MAGHLCNGKYKSVPSVLCRNGQIILKDIRQHQIFGVSYLPGIRLKAIPTSIAENYGLMNGRYKPFYNIDASAGNYIWLDINQVVHLL